MVMKRLKVLALAVILAIGGGLGLPTWEVQAADPAQQEIQKININMASRDELMKLRGVGTANADRIIEYREKHGPFQKPEDITKVKGIGPKTWEENKELISIE